MARSNGTKELPTDLIDEVKKDLSITEFRQFEAMERRVSKMWRNFWIGVLQNHGYSNSEIAAEVGLTESAVRAILQK